MNEENKNLKSDAAKREEAVLEFWKENKIFEKSLDQTKKGKEFIFYEGPPTANGKPGIHHLEARAFKDAIPRYKTMQGFHVRRKGGWDTHGLPVELQVEKKLGLNSKKAIEEYGIEKFNKECKESVWEYLDVWNKFTKRIGYWVDQDKPFVTYENDYIESVWNVLKKVNDQKLLFKDYKVVPWCPRCGTALSSHELAQGYEDVKDLSVYVKFKVKGEKFKDTYILAWTTTPWTLPGNVALAVGKDIKYSWIQTANDLYIIASDLIPKLFTSETIKVKDEFYSKDLIGLEYEPLFSFLADGISESEKPKLGKAFKVYAADFVNTQDGTGIVHTAVMYGQDDFALGTEVGLPKHHLVNLEGKFIKGTGFLEGRFVRETDPNGKPTLAVDIIDDLKKRNLFFKQENYKHSYPHCWRCKTALIYYARDSWYIRMSDPKIKKELISENKKINWEPEYIREGRFGEWLKEIKDWAISRERYWGTPLPVWICTDCKKTEVVGSIEDLKEKTKKSGNKYFAMRHGQADNNVNDFHYRELQESAALTEIGRDQIKKSIKNFNHKIDVVISSTLKRAKQTTQVVCENIKFPLENVVYDERAREWEVSSLFDGKERVVFKKYYNVDYLDNPGEVLPEGESFAQVIKRVGDFIYDLEKKYSGKNILIVGHEGATRALSFLAKGLSFSDLSSENDPLVSLKNAEIKEFNFVPLPHNENYELDLHKPFIDEIKLSCKCGGDLIRTKEVMDVWFDSGAMPFAQDHYPFDPTPKQAWYGAGNKKSQQILYPADFICEAVDQTRGWFYTLHAVGILMGRGKAYKNVICLGHLLDANGKKMSKSIGNVVDPWIMMEKYGVDTLRLWMYSVNQPGESKNFDEKTVQLLHSQVFGLLYNVLAFYELYRDKNLEKNDKLKSKNILDVWILARLDELVKLSTENLDSYKLLEPVRGMRDFIGDLSTWYLRRSRERIKNDDKDAKQTLYFVLKSLAKILAPFAPFTAEDIWLKLKTKDDVESVHLAEWPKAGKIHSGILENMRIVRNIVSLGLKERQKAILPVRQTLSKLEVKNFDLSKEYIELVKDELNVKEVKQNKNLEAEVALDTTITPELKAEGDYREFMRSIQDKRKELNLAPSDKMALPVETIYKIYKIMPVLEMHMLRVAAVATLICDNFEGFVPKEEIITVCLLHDMGNIIKSNFEFMPESLEPEGLEYWQNVKDEFVKKYGNDEEKAHGKIMEEIGVSKKIIGLVNKISFKYACDYKENKDFVIKIINYADWRVSPCGVVSFDERMIESKSRYKLKTKAEEDERERLIICAKEIEKQIFAKCKIKPEDINDETATPIISKLKNFMIK